MKATLTKTWRGFSVGQQVTMLIKTRGATADDEEIEYPAGTFAVVTAVANFGPYQGHGVDLVVGYGHHAICNSLDDRDVNELGRSPFIAA